MCQAPVKVKLLSFSLNKTTEQSMKLKDVKFQFHERGNHGHGDFLPQAALFTMLLKTQSGNLAHQNPHDC